MNFLKQAFNVTRILATEGKTSDLEGHLHLIREKPLQNQQ